MLLTISQTAREFALSIETVRRRIRAGEWPTYKLGAHSVRLDPDEIREIARRDGLRKVKPGKGRAKATGNAKAEHGC